MLATTAAMIEQFNMENIKLLNDMGYIVDVAGNFQKGNPISVQRLDSFKAWVEERNGRCYDISSVRNPINIKANLAAYRDVVRIVKENKYKFIHCHTPIGAVIGRLAAHRTYTPIIYTAHGFHFFKGAPMLNWMIYYPVEWILSYWTDLLILINKEDYQIAKRKMKAKKICYVPGIGVDTCRFNKKKSDEAKKLFRQKYNIPREAKIILSVGELIERKNHGFVIEALAELECDNVYYIICGKGPLEKELLQKAKRHGIEKKVLLIGFIDDVSEVYPVVDMFVFPSKQEGLSVALMEAMAAGLPCLASKIRGNTDLLDDDVLFSLDNVQELILKLNTLLNDGEMMKNKALENSTNIKKLDCKYIRENMKTIYSEIVQTGG